MFDKDVCSPKSNKNGSCFDRKSLEKIANILKKKGYNINIKSTSLQKEISNTIQTMSNCQSEKCWLSITDLINGLSKKDIKYLQSFLKPGVPDEWKNKMNTWLSNIDIEKVLNQYTEAHKEFYSYGASPIDIDHKNVCDKNGLCKFNLQNHINNGHTKIGIVLNTDPHTGSGEHWICIYIDLKGINYKNPTIYYFDSVGEKPPQNIEEFVYDIRKQGETIGLDLNYTYNDIQHQTGNNECGVYCLHFIVYMLNNGNFQNYIKHKKNDQYIHKFRKFFFNV